MKEVQFLLWANLTLGLLIISKFGGGVVAWVVAGGTLIMMFSNIIAKEDRG